MTTAGHDDGASRGGAVDTRPTGLPGVPVVVVGGPPGTAATCLPRLIARGCPVAVHGTWPSRIHRSTPSPQVTPALRANLARQDRESRLRLYRPYQASPNATPTPTPSTAATTGTAGRSRSRR